MFKQWPKRCLKQVTTLPLLALLIITTLLIATWQLISYWQINHWQHTLLEKLNSIKVIEKKSVKIVAEASLKSMKELSLIQVDLPSLPSNKLTGEENNTKKIAKPQVSAAQVRQDTLTKQAKQSMQNKQSIENQNTSAMYQRLISDSSIDIEIAWPDNNADRQKIFTYLYQCLGLKFGVLNRNKEGQTQITLATHSYQEMAMNTLDADKTSDWLRIAQGQLASQELHWLQQYALSGTAVRLFPKIIDWQLARLLAQQLKSAPLTSFRARYYHLGERFMLTNIRLNERLLANNWTLVSKRCAI